MRAAVVTVSDGVAAGEREDESGALLVELADRPGLRWIAGSLDGSRAARSVRHRAGEVLADLAVMLADGGDCLSDLAALRDQPGLFGPVASTPTTCTGRATCRGEARSPRRGMGERGRPADYAATAPHGAIDLRRQPCP